MLNLRARGLVAATAVLALALAACGGDEPSQPTGDGGTGTVPIAGSSTVGPISIFVAEDFGGDAAVAITGTGGGFKEQFCTGMTAVNNASRQIKDSERELCADNGIENVLELKIGVDGITVLTSTDNDTGIDCLDLNEIYALVGPESGLVSTWSDANALVADLGGGHNASLPDVELTTAGPGTESGTYDSFFELAIEHIADEREQDEKFRPDWTGSNDDNVIIQGLAGNQYSFGWVGFAYYSEVRDQVTAIAVEDADGTCVAPSAETIASNAYPLSRDLFVYVNLDELDNADYGQTLRAYIDYYLSDQGRELVSEAGYVQLDDASWDATVAVWSAAK